MQSILQLAKWPMRQIIFYLYIDEMYFAGLFNEPSRSNRLTRKSTRDQLVVFRGIPDLIWLRKMSEVVVVGIVSLEACSCLSVGPGRARAQNDQSCTRTIVTAPTRKIAYCYMRLLPRMLDSQQSEATKDIPNIDFGGSGGKAAPAMGKAFCRALRSSSNSEYLQRRCEKRTDQESVGVNTRVHVDRTSHGRHH